MTKHDQIILKKSNFLAEGASQRIFPHPENDQQLIKIPFDDGKGGQKNRIRKLVRYSFWRYGNYKSWHDDYEQYIAITGRLNKLPTFVPRLYGFVETNLGCGMVVEKVSASNGNLAKTLGEYRDSNEDLPAIRAAINVFFDAFIESHCVATDLHLRNIEVVLQSRTVC